MHIHLLYNYTKTTFYLSNHLNVFQTFSVNQSNSLQKKWGRLTYPQQHLGMRPNNYQWSMEAFGGETIPTGLFLISLLGKHNVSSINLRNDITALAAYGDVIRRDKGCYIRYYFLRWNGI